MINLKNIYKQAKKNNKTGNMTYKEFKELMKDKGISNKDIKKSLQARNYASQVFYTPKPQQVILDPDMPEVESESFSYNRAIPIAAYSPEYYNLQEVKVPSNPILVPIKGRDKAAEMRAAEKAKEMTEEMFSNYTSQLFNKMRQDAEWRDWNNVGKWNTNPRNTRNYGYYQQGGAVKAQSSQQDAVIQFVKALAQTLQADPQQIIQAAQQNPEALKSAVQVYQESKGDIQKAAQAFSQVISSKTQAAKHGAKLNYLKSLKNKCAENEELYYFKKGGSIGCGCKKKEQGGELKEKKESTISKFKKACGGFKVKFMTGGQSPKKKNLDQASKDSIEINDNQNMELMLERPGKLIPNPKYDKGKTDDRAQLWVPDRTKTPYKKEEKVNKNYCGSKMKLKKGDKVCPKCGKVHTAGMGCSVAKFKYRKLGGQL